MCLSDILKKGQPSSSASSTSVHVVAFVKRTFLPMGGGGLLFAERGEEFVDLSCGFGILVYGRVRALDKEWELWFLVKRRGDFIRK